MKRVLFANYGTDVDEIHRLTSVELAFDINECRLISMVNSIWDFPAVVVVETNGRKKTYRKKCGLGMTGFNGETPRIIEYPYEIVETIEKPLIEVDVTKIVKFVD
jgi:hypothetical protein